MQMTQLGLVVGARVVNVGTTYLFGSPLGVIATYTPGDEHVLQLCFAAADPSHNHTLLHTLVG